LKRFWGALFPVVLDEFKRHELVFKSKEGFCVWTRLPASIHPPVFPRRSPHPLLEQPTEMLRVLEPTMRLQKAEN